MTTVNIPGLEVLEPKLVQDILATLTPVGKIYTNESKQEARTGMQAISANL